MTSNTNETPEAKKEVCTSTDVKKDGAAATEVKKDGCTADVKKEGSHGTEKTGSCG
jgi:hypothetical protein